MNSRERILSAFHRQKVDRLPCYYCAQLEVEEHLISYLGLSSQNDLLQKFGCDLINIVPDYVGPHNIPAWTNTNPPESLDALRRGDFGALNEYHFPESWWYDGKTVVSKIQKAKQFNYAIALGDEALGSLLTMTGSWFGWEHLLTLMYDKPEFVHKLLEKISMTVWLRQFPVMMFLEDSLIFHKFLLLTFYTISQTRYDPRTISYTYPPSY